MSDDVKTLREAAEWASVYGIRSAESAQAFAILCRRTADAIEREGGNTILGMPVVVRDDAPPGMLAFVQDGKLIGGIKDINPSALSEAEDRGWNACMSAIQKEYISYDTEHRDRHPEKFDDFAVAYGMLQAFMRRIASLRRGASS